MFTGIILGTSKLLDIQNATYTIERPEFLNNLQIGQSIATDGVCLTIINFNNTSFQVEVMPETKRKSNFENKKLGDLVNLELAMPAHGRFDGHIVQGHVDGIGKVIDIQKDGNAYLMEISLPKKIKPYCIPEGSITINGISFTLARLNADSFTIGIIPHTWEITNLKELKVNDTVNLEGDVVGKYLARFQELQL